MLFGTESRFFLGKPFVQPQGADAAAIHLGDWASSPQVQSALQVNVLFIIGRCSWLSVTWAFRNTRWGLVVTHGGRQLGRCARHGLTRGTRCACWRPRRWIPRRHRRLLLSLYYPGSWNEGLSSGQGLMAVALVIFAPLAAAVLLLRRAAVRRGRITGAGPAVGWHYEWLLLVQCRALRVDPGHHDRDLLAAGVICWGAWGVECHKVKS